MSARPSVLNDGELLTFLIPIFASPVKVTDGAGASIIISSSMASSSMANAMLPESARAETEIMNFFIINILHN